MRHESFQANIDAKVSRGRDANGGSQDKEGSEMEEISEILDRTAALASVGGDLEFLSELLGLFRATSSTLLRDIQEALVKVDLPHWRMPRTL